MDRKPFALAGPLFWIAIGLRAAALPACAGRQAQPKLPPPALAPEIPHESLIPVQAVSVEIGQGSPIEVNALNDANFDETGLHQGSPSRAI